MNMDYSVLNSSSIFFQPVQHVANDLWHGDFEGITFHFSINGNCQIYHPCRLARIVRQW